MRILPSSCQAISDDLEPNAFVLSFTFGKVVTTVRIILKDTQSAADLAITNMTTLPPQAARHGFGSSALQLLIGAAHKNGIRHIQAVQVQPQSESFWRKNGFVALGNITNDFLYAPH